MNDQKTKEDRYDNDIKRIVDNLDEKDFEYDIKKIHKIIEKLKVIIKMDENHLEERPNQLAYREEFYNAKTEIDDCKMIVECLDTILFMHLQSDARRYGLYLDKKEDGSLKYEPVNSFYGASGGKPKIGGGNNKTDS